LILDKQELLLSKKLLLSYKERLEKEIINRSNKLRIPPQALQEVITKNDEIKELKNAIKTLENKSQNNKKTN
tara:strand:- start:3250 stop:3465 length:216 start_codon:yes stop_codon:yes gene_type:complete